MQTQINKQKVTKVFRSPTLDTVDMVEGTIKEFSGEFKKTQIWEELPKKVMWQTYLIILNYLEEINKIITSDNGVITYIWDPQGAQKFFSRKAY